MYTYVCTYKHTDTALQCKKVNELHMYTYVVFVCREFSRK